MCQYISVYSISRMFVATDVALAGASGIGYVVLIFAHGLIRNRIIWAELGTGADFDGQPGNITDAEIEALHRRIETTYFPLLYSVGVLALGSFVGLTLMVHRAVKKEQITWLRLWALLHGLLLVATVAFGAWAMGRGQGFGVELGILVILAMYRLSSILVILLLSLVLQYALAQPPTPARIPGGLAAAAGARGMSVHYR